MSINIKDFPVPEGAHVNLKKWSTKIDPVCESKEQYAKLLDEYVRKLSTLQQLLYAANSYALLLIFQAMDAAFQGAAATCACTNMGGEIACRALSSHKL